MWLTAEEGSKMVHWSTICGSLFSNKVDEVACLMKQNPTLIFQKTIYYKVNEI